MQTKSIGVGSASLILIFTVLCLAVFAIISRTAAVGDMTRARASAEIVELYYEAVVLAEQITAELTHEQEEIEPQLSARRDFPDSLYGVPITQEYNEETDELYLSFSCPMSERKELYVKIVYYSGKYDILVWQMRDTVEWNPDMSLPVWR